jgi:hypothetical protein
MAPPLQIGIKLQTDPHDTLGVLVLTDGSYVDVVTLMKRHKMRKYNSRIISHRLAPSWFGGKNITAIR